MVQAGAEQLDIADLSTKDLNRRLKSLAEKGAEVLVLNPQARHNLAVGVLKPCSITFEGSVGYYCCSFCDGPNFIINGNAGWGLGSNLMSGRITVRKSVGSSVGCSMRGGEVLVSGNAGARSGISMKGGRLIVRGNAGYLAGYLMQKGEIIICGDTGDALADSMYEGLIYVGGEIGSLGNDAKLEDISEKETQSITGLLSDHGITGSFDWKKVVSAKKLYHYDELEPLEKVALGRSL